MDPPSTAHSGPVGEHEESPGGTIIGTVLTSDPMRATRLMVTS